jgi:hypothetical protein
MSIFLELATESSLVRLRSAQRMVQPPQRAKRAAVG